MGNKQAKPSKPSAPAPAPASAPAPARAKPSEEQQAAPPPAPAPAAAPAAAGAAEQPRSLPQTRSLLETKLAHVDVAAVFSTSEILSLRKHLAAVLGLGESDAIVIPRDEFFRFLVGSSGSSLYANRLYAIFDMDKKGYVRHRPARETACRFERATNCCLCAE